MALGTLAVVGVVNMLTALAFGVVGARLLRRPVQQPDRLALQAIATWWLSMGLLVAIQAFEVFATTAGYTDLRVSTAARYANAVLLAVGGWGLCFHVLYLRTGNRAWALPLAPYYMLVAAGYLASVALHPLLRLEPTAYEVTGVYDPPLEGSTVWNLVVAGVGLPLIAVCVLYLLLSRKLERRDQKRRAVLASSGILVWVSAGLVAQLTGSPLADFITITLLGLMAAVLVLLAYFPPAWLSRNDPIGPYLEVRHEPPPLPPEQQLYQR
ncbi:MAG: hypothetical protein WC876_04745 [Candidatus Thermoplasmatota archaeon]|jgi:hypothetical protein